MINFSRQQHLIWQAFSIDVILANYIWLQWPILGVIFGFFYLWFNSKKISDLFFPKIRKGLKSTCGFVVLLAYVSVVYTIFYHAWLINFWTFLWTLVSIPILVEFFSYKLFFPNSINIMKFTSANFDRMMQRNKKIYSSIILQAHITTTSQTHHIICIHLYL